jgi:hypothetical protein
MKKRLLYAAWAITPLIVCVFAFFFGWIGALLGGRLMWLVSGGMLGGLLGLIAWTTSINYVQKRHPPEES